MSITNRFINLVQITIICVLLSIIEESGIRTGEKMRILLGKIFGVCYSIIISVCLVYVKRQTSYFFYLHSTIQNQQYQRIERQVRGSARNKVVVPPRLQTETLVVPVVARVPPDTLQFAEPPTSS